jgi:pSer/pThr/pTyr-binding forkhead associated (FHA) protein
MGIEGPAAGQRFAIDQTDYWIGAESNNHCRITSDSALSANHACIRLESGSLKIHDNRSANNTYVNQNPIGTSAALLQPGDQIRMGRCVFRLEAC